MAFSDTVSEMDAAALEAFGETVSYEPASGGGPLSITAIFFDGNQESQGIDIVFEGTGPRFVVHRDDVPTPKKGDMIERESGARYVVTNPDDDEHTLAFLRCRKTTN